MSVAGALAPNANVVLGVDVCFCSVTAAPKFIVEVSALFPPKEKVALGCALLSVSWVDVGVAFTIRPPAPKAALLGSADLKGSTFGGVASAFVVVVAAAPNWKLAPTAGLSSFDVDEAVLGVGAPNENPLSVLLVLTVPNCTVLAAGNEFVFSSEFEPN